MKRLWLYNPDESKANRHKQNVSSDLLGLY